MATVTSIGIALGLILALFGQIALLRSLRSCRSDEALSLLGLVFLAVGAVGWVEMQGLNLEMADTSLEYAPSFQSAAAVFRVEFGISLIAGLAVALGFLLFSLGLAIRDEFNRIAAGIIAVVSVIALVSQIIGVSVTPLLQYHDPDKSDLLRVLGNLEHIARSGPSQTECVQAVT